MNSFLFSVIPLFAFVIYKSLKTIHMLQQNYYNESNRFVFWIFKNLKKVFINWDILLFLSILTAFMSVNVGAIYVCILTSLTLLIFYNYNKKEQTKKPLVITSRVKRLLFTILLIHALTVAVIYFNYVEAYTWYYYLCFSILIYLNSFVVVLANIINKPAEAYVYHYYKSKAMKKMKTMNIPVIGVTGSYGKTSSKNIIWDILNVKMNPFKTPSNFNTPYGLIRSINNHLDKFNDIFIAEMGAFKIGEIRKTCKLMKPKYGVLTIIGEAHLESFGSQENIQKGKFELVESLPSDGVAILNGDDPYQLSYKIKNKCKVLWIGINNHDVDLYASNIKLSHLGTTFDVTFKDKGTYSFQTKLLGQHNIYNILEGIMLGYHLGLSIEELKRGVSSKMAVDVLGMMDGKKIIVTPGMIELGDKQYELNYKFGEYISSSADYVILVGREQTKPILEGLKNKKYNEKNIFVTNNVLDAFPLMQKLKNGETYVLLENDLPDLFNER